ncbi:MAG: DUF1963 domain-containing protein [Oscillospiraceae bacterium]|nr:DUF1963 domain-containing protein [Oscillospiraceae bacterium]
MSYNLDEIKKKYGKNAVSLTMTEKNTEFCCTKIGGKPDLPADFEWPYYESEDYKGINANRPLSFMAQINFAEIKPYDEENLLPESGMLYFFYELMSMEWGSSPESRNCSKVFYYDGDLSKLKNTELPEDLKKYDSECILPEIAVQIDNFTDVPDLCELPENLNDDNYEDEDYCDDRYEMQDTLWAKILGYADIIQDTMLFECEAVSRGYNLYSEPPEFSEEEEKDIERCSSEWILLFEMDSIDYGNYELIFGDSGRIYFYIRKEDLKKRDFSNVYFSLQCY